MSGNIQFNGTQEEWDALVKKNRQTTVKLYTEEQVREVVRLSLEDAETSVIWSKEWYPQKLADKILQSLKPIELPSDEEIDKKSFERLTLAQISGFRLGAKWMKDKILNK